MKKKALLISLISLLVVGAVILLIPNLIRKEPKVYEPTDIENSMLIPQKIVYNYEGEIPDTFTEPNYFVKNSVLSYSLVGQIPLNDFNYTDLGARYETELSTSNFDDLFKSSGAWAKGFDAKYLRENCISVLRTDITEGVMLTEIPLGERFYYIVFVKDEIYICYYNNGQMLNIVEADIQEFDFNSDQ